MSYVILHHSKQHLDLPSLCYIHFEQGRSDLLWYFGSPSLLDVRITTAPVGARTLSFSCLDHSQRHEPRLTVHLPVGLWHLCPTTPTAPEFWSNQTKVVDQPPETHISKNPLCLLCTSLLHSLENPLRRE